MTSIRSRLGAQQYCMHLLRTNDRSSYIIQRYIPELAKDSVLAIRSFGIETARIADTVTKPELAKIRYDFWRNTIQNALGKRQETPSEPISLLLWSSTEWVPLSRRYFITVIQTRESYMVNKPFRTLDTMAQYGEGTWSQLGYLIQEAMEPLVTENELQQQELNSEIIAHIGQATAIAQFLKAFPYYVQHHNMVSLPTDVMAKHNISQETVLQGKPDQHRLADVAFETATRANDHLISARTKLQNLKSNVASKRLTDAVFVPLMSALPVQLYLERLESVNFDLLSGKLQAEWKLPYRTWKSYRKQEI